MTEKEAWKEKTILELKQNGNKFAANAILKRLGKDYDAVSVGILLQKAYHVGAMDGINRAIERMDLQIAKNKAE